MKFMPLLYAVWGYAFPAGLIVYWTTANGIQIGQQAWMLRAGHIGPEALERRMAEQKARAADGKPQRKGLMGWMNEKAEAAQKQQDPSRTKRPPQTPGRSGTAKPNARKPTSGKGGAKPGNQLKPKPTPKPKPKKQP
jgi:YidC/Oxa1 family membrane protein insertase